MSCPQALIRIWTTVIGFFENKLRQVCSDMNQSDIISAETLYPSNFVTPSIGVKGVH